MALSLSTTFITLLTIAMEYGTESLLSLTNSQSEVGPAYTDTIVITIRDISLRDEFVRFGLSE